MPSCISSSAGGEKRQRAFSEAYQVEKRRREEYEKRQNQEIIRKNIVEIVDNCINTINIGRSIKVEEVLNEVRECLEQLDLSSIDSNDPIASGILDIAEGVDGMVDKLTIGTKEILNEAGLTEPEFSEKTDAMLDEFINGYSSLEISRLIPRADKQESDWKKINRLCKDGIDARFDKLFKGRDVECDDARRLIDELLQIPFIGIQYTIPLRISDRQVVKKFLKSSLMVKYYLEKIVNNFVRIKDRIDFLPILAEVGNSAMGSKEQNSKLIVEITELKKKYAGVEAENIEVKAENVKLRWFIKENTELKTRIEELEKNRIDTTAENAELKLEDGDNSSKNIVNVPNPVIDQCIDINSKSLEDKEMNNFLDEKNKAKVYQKSACITNTEASSLRKTSDNCKNRPYRAKNIIKLYQNACNAEESVMKANQEEILCWCLYAKEFKDLFRYFMTKYNIGEKKAKGLVYDFIIEQLLNTKQENLCKQTQRAIKIFNLFEKIGTDKIQYIKTYSVNFISKFTNKELQKVIDYFSSNHDNSFTEILMTLGFSNYVIEIPESSLESIPTESQVSDSSSSEPSQKNNQDKSKT
ncbi:12831_t:CDS:2 [Cetraspora pellucida]|uniref:12831_t:CDS:1 n=1 Tax=Cetraspora pellucida TaxID=1433469 RepID=A0ACA9M3I1_9GLOM|nr:12831_t:CDS:2 [Cetraspora pellucida]